MFRETYINFGLTNPETVHISSETLYETKNFSPNYTEKKNFGGSFEFLIQFKDLIKRKHNLIW